MRPDFKLRRRFAFLALWLPVAALAQFAPIGLSEVRARFLDNEDLFLYGPEAEDHFGIAVTAGDFNGDGAADLAVGMPDDDEIGGDCVNCGMVVVRWGIPGVGLAGGLATTVLHQGLAGSPNAPAAQERFGAALAAGDFNGDGYDDLAVGAPAIALSGSFGGVEVYYGWSTGFQTEFAEYIDEAGAGGGVHVTPGSEFGATLAVGNFDHDPYDDLAIGAPLGREWRAEGPVVRGGSVYVAHGQEWGLLPWFGYRISQDEVDMQDVAEEGDQFGRALAAGDFSPDSYDDLAIGVPGENDYGLIQTLFGSQFGLLFATNIVWLPGALGEEPEAGDRLGWSLAAGDFDGDLYDDLAVANPREDVCEPQTLFDAGRVSIAFGSNSGFDLARTKRIDEGASCGGTYAGAFFGWALAAGDFDGDGKGDLAIGQPNNDSMGEATGRTDVLMGEFGDQFGVRRRSLAPGVWGTPPQNQPEQHFGGALAAGDFDGDGWSDLAIGVPFHDQPGLADVGGVTVLYGALFADGFEIGSTDRWSDSHP